MAGDIKQKIVLEGEKEYNAAIKEAQRNLKVLRSELKAETAELGKNATAQQQNEAKVKSLQKQIKEQEKIVRTYEDALKQVKAQYGDNEEAIARWEIKLNDARTALANMRNGLESTGTSMKKVGDNAQMSVVAANNLAEAFAKIGNAGSVISGALEGAFSGIADRIRDTIADVWDSIVDLAARSNNLVDLAGFWGTDVNTIQRYQGAVASASATLEDLNNIVTKINAGDAKKIAELTGVSGEEYQDQWKYAMAVMDAMSKMSTEQRNAAGFELFGGRQATKAFDLLNDWATVQANLDKFDREQGGYGLTEEEMRSMSDLYDKVNGLRASWEALQGMAQVHLFGDLAMDITGNIQEIVDAFKDYFMADNDSDRAKALEQVKENVIEIFKNIRDGIQEGLKIMGEIAQELQGSDDPILQALGTALDAIVEGFKWIANPENWGAVKRAFEVLIAVWTGAKIMEAIGNLGSFAGNIGTLLLAKDLKAISSAGAAVGTSWGAAFGSAVLKAVPWLAGVLTLITPADTADDSTEAWKEFEEKHPVNIPNNFDTETNSWDVSNTTVAQSVPVTKAQMEATEALEEWESEHGKPVVENGLTIQPAGMRPGAALTKEQAEATERFWDAWRGFMNGGGSGESIDAFDEADAAWRAAFEGQDGLLDKIDHLIMKMEEQDDWTHIEDLPASFWEDAGGVSESDLQGFRSVPNAMVAAVRTGAAEGVSGIRVFLDGETVGRLVAPYVSQGIARDVLISPV